jgi:Raf kinase inhibitor-like YbhB/YbcL family protein
MRLVSDAFAHGQTIPRRFTCDGDDLSPPLAWSETPTGTKSFVLLCDDPDAPGGKWHHWAAYNIAASSTALAEGAGRAGATDFRQGTNDFSRVGYGGPCPPRGHGPHRYNFRLLALSADHLPLRAAPSCTEVEREARKHVLAEATLIGLYQRQR